MATNPTENAPEESLHVAPRPDESAEDDGNIWDLSGMYFDAYEEILKGLSPKDCKVARFVIPLVAVAVSYQALTTRDLATAYLLATEIWTGDTTPPPPVDVLHQYTNVYKACGDLLFLAEQDDRIVVKFTDETARAMLVANERFYEAAHFIMFKACWKYILLNFDEIRDGDIYCPSNPILVNLGFADEDLAEETTPDYGFREYAANKYIFNKHVIAAAHLLLTHLTLDDFNEIPKIADGLLCEFVKQHSPHLLEMFLKKRDRAEPKNH